MAVGTYFRSAWNGFNRNDVVNYMEECAANYERSLRQLQNENARLREELSALKAAQETVQAAPPEPAPAPEVQPEPAPAAANPAGDELEAYRRAEAVERAARDRAEKLQKQLQEILSTAVTQFEAAGADAEAQMSDLSISLRRLNDTFAALRLTFEDTGKALNELK